MIGYDEGTGGTVGGGPALAELKSYKELVVDHLRRSIISGELETGTQLPQDKIAARLGVSRTPVREALLQLQAEGLVHFARHRVATVATLSRDEIRDVFEVRAVVEARAVELGVPQLTDAEVRELARCHREMCAFRKWSSEWLQHNRRFHRIMYEASQRRYMCQVISGVQAQLDRYLSLYLSTLDVLKKAHKEHSEILEAARRRDASGAAELTHRHILETADALLEHIEKERGRAPTPVRGSPMFPTME